MPSDRIAQILNIEEIFLAILSLLPCHQLYRTALVSKRWKMTAQEIMNQVLHISSTNLELARSYARKNDSAYKKLKVNLDTGYFQSLLILTAMDKAAVEKLRTLELYTSIAEISPSWNETASTFPIQIRDLLPSIATLVLHPIHSRLFEEMVLSFENIVSLTLYTPLEETIEWHMVELNQLTDLTVVAPKGNKTFLQFVDRYVVAPRLQSLILSIDLAANSAYIRRIVTTYSGTLTHLRIVGTKDDCVFTQGLYICPLRPLKHLQELTIETCFLPILLHSIPHPDGRSPFPSLQTLVLEERWSSIIHAMETYNWTDIRSILDHHHATNSMLKICCGYTGAEVQGQGYREEVIRLLIGGGNGAMSYNVEQVKCCGIVPYRRPAESRNGWGSGTSSW
ncbi:hypothetical protein AAF712_006933 [Marasmius tenuissimus]|uniref:F-box domain-containing protein n=1 Tax=Marasmius tenuissimus TaxID=585030 RepID=A0ABR2ZWX7_9AGAR